MQTPSGSTHIQARHGCRYCHSASLRRSRVRRPDVPKVLLLRWPVRCLSCGKRQFVGLPVAWRAISSRAPHAPELARQESWQDFTSATEPHAKVGEGER